MKIQVTGEENDGSTLIDSIYDYARVGECSGELGSLLCHDKGGVVRKGKGDFSWGSAFYEGKGWKL